MSRGEPQGRNRALDGLKLVVAFLIVGGHVLGEYLFRNGWSLPVGFLFGVTQLAVPTFFVISGILHGRRLDGSRPSSWLFRRERRLILPYVIWSAVYLLAAFAATGVRISGSRPLDLVGIVFLGGAFQTLWFLPALIYSVLLAWLLLRVMPPVAAFAVALLVAVAGMLPPPLRLSMPLGLGLWLAIYLAGVWLASARSLPRLPAAAVAVASVVLIAGCGAIYGVYGGAPGWSDFAGKLLAALCALVLAAAALRAPDARVLATFAFGAPLLLGIYLVHPLVERVLTKSWPATGAPAGLWIPIVFGATALVSSGVVAAMLRIPYLRATVR